MSIRDWSDRIAGLAVDALLRAGIVQAPDFERAVGIVEEEIRVRLSLDDYPPTDDAESHSDEA